MSKKDKENWLEVGCGHAGWHASKHHCSSSGGSLEGYLAEAAEGCLVYDAEKADPNAFIKYVVSGPVVGYDLPAGSVDKFSLDDRKAMSLMSPGLSGGFETIATIALDTKYTGLDRVSLDVYEVLLRAVPGMKVGHVKNGKVVWEE